MPRRALFSLVLLLSLGLLGCSPLFNLGRQPLEEVTVMKPKHFYTLSRFLVIDVSGLISTTKSEELLREGTSMVEDIHDALVRARRDPTIKAVILRIDSPGGEVTASDVIHHEIRRYAEESDVPVVAEMMGMATSGGYYIASAADRIVAHPTTVTGSIGVMLLTLNVEGLENLVGVQVGAITSGTHKDILSPFRPMTDEEREIIQNIINSLYDRFLDVVEEGRGEAGLTRERLRPLADGRIFTAQQALDAGLIDEISYLPDLVDSLKRDLGLRDVKVVSYRRGASGDYDIYSRGGAQPRVDVSLIDPKVLSRDLRPGFYYLWQPGL